MKKNSDTATARSLTGTLGTASTIGLHMISGPLVGGGIGYAIDKWLDSLPWGAAIGFLFGIAAGFRMVYDDAGRIIRAHDEVSQAKREESDESA